MSEVLSCWKCGHALDDVPLPLRRRDECPACGTDLHVCRMCEFYDPSVAKSCREPIAEEVTDKERANFCDYFRGRPGVQAAGGAGAWFGRLLHPGAGDVPKGSGGGACRLR